MTWVKLCGLRTRGDVEAAVEAGADAVGFVIAPSSVRHISPELAGEIGLDAPIERYLVTVDLRADAVLAACSAAGADGVQPHGRHSGDSARVALAAGLKVLFPIAVGADVELGDVPDGAMPLLDTAVPGAHGGTGRVFDWRLAAGLDGPFVLAGGLTPANVANAVDLARPWGVDVSSGIESAPGEKDHKLMHQFVEALR